MIEAVIIRTPAAQAAIARLFLRFGEFIMGGSHFPLTSDALKKVFTGQASREVLLSIAHAVRSKFGFLYLFPLRTNTLTKMYFV